MPYVEHAGARIFWDEDGPSGRGEGDAGGAGPAGPAGTVLLINGLGYPGTMWYRVVPYLADRYRTLWLDNRGVGRTGVPEGGFTIEQMADDAAAVLDAAGGGTAHVVGASLGGFVAQEVALRHPTKVASLALVCTNCNGPEAVPPSPEALEMLGTRRSLTPREAAELALPFIYAPGTDRARIDEDIEVRMRQPTSPEGYTKQLEAAIAHGGTYARLPEITAPTLVLHGTLDKLVDPANAPMLAERIPGAQLVMVEGASHILFTDRTEEVGRALRSFVDSVARPAS